MNIPHDKYKTSKKLFSDVIRHINKNKNSTKLNDFEKNCLKNMILLWNGCHENTLEFLHKLKEHHSSLNGWVMANQQDAFCDVWNRYIKFSQNLRVDEMECAAQNNNENTNIEEDSSDN